MRGLILLETVAVLASAAFSFAGFATAAEPRPPTVRNETNEASDARTHGDSALSSMPAEPKLQAESAAPSKVVETPSESPAPGAESIPASPKLENGAAATIKISGSVAAKPVEDPALPARIPGHELRVLDVRKDVFFHVNGTWIQTAVPIYFYYPTNGAERTRGIELLRQARDDARKLGEISTEKTPELERVIANLDEAIAALEKQP